LYGLVMRRLLDSLLEGKPRFGLVGIEKMIESYCLLGKVAQEAFQIGIELNDYKLSWENKRVQGNVAVVVIEKMIGWLKLFGDDTMGPAV